jgi:hypothetical protein
VVDGCLAAGLERAWEIVTAPLATTAPLDATAAPPPSPNGARP